jgi:hypothetical protein
MARALAAMCPPLTSADVSDAAHQLAARVGRASLLDAFLRHGAELMSARQVVEALSALRDTGPAHPCSVAAPGATVSDSQSASCQHALADQLLVDLLDVLSRVTSPAGAHSIVRRAINLAEVDFPFLERVHTRRMDQTDFSTFSDSISRVGPDEADRAVTAVLGHALSLMSGCVGRDVTFRLLRRGQT